MHVCIVCITQLVAIKNFNFKLQALADSDVIHCILTTQTNCDGYTTPLTSPSSEAQQNLLLQCAKHAGIAPNKIGFVEMHGIPYFLPLVFYVQN